MRREEKEGKALGGRSECSSCWSKGNRLPEPHLRGKVAQVRLVGPNPVKGILKEVCMDYVVAEKQFLGLSAVRCLSALDSAAT